MIGRYPAMTLKEARKKARTILYDKDKYKRSQEIEIGYDEAVDKYLLLKGTEVSVRTLENYTRLLRWLQFKSMVSDIRPYQVGDALERVVGQTNRSHAFTILKGFFNWCVAREYCEKNPMENLKKPRMPPARDRVLSNNELVEIWRACEELGNYGLIVRILMLTGQRKAQIANLHESWVHKEHIIYPASIMKNRLEHYCPIGRLTREMLMRALPVEGYYFSPLTSVGRPFSNWSKAKEKLDRMIDIDPWVHHDLRRTWSTNAAELKVPPPVTSRVLSHATPEGKMSAIYNRHKYKKEMSAAMNKIDSHILELLSS